MKLGLISDIHGNSPALKVVLERLPNEVDQIAFLGDLCGYYPFVNECIVLWDRQRILGVRGNRDQLFLDCIKTQSQPDHSYESKYGSALRRSLESALPEVVVVLESLPPSCSLTIQKTVLVLYHGSPWNPLEGRVYPDYRDWDRFSNIAADVILLGHTHYPFVKRYGDKLIVNPGSVGQPRDLSTGACYATLDLDSGAVQQLRIPYEKSCIIDDARLHDPDKSYLIKVLNR